MYYYSFNGQQAGPVPEDQLRGMVSTGSLTPDTLIWREGMTDWQPYSTVLGAASPGGSAPVQCSVCHQTFPVADTIKYGTVHVCANCKPRFMQGLREGAAPAGTMELAGTGARFAAKFLDNIILGVVQQVANFAVTGSIAQSAGPGGNPTAAMTLAFGLMAFNMFTAIAYQAIFLKWKGQTLGKMALKIKVVTPEGDDLSWGKAIGRPFAEILSGCTLAIGYLMALWDDEKRTLHDRLAGTRVIKAG